MTANIPALDWISTAVGIVGLTSIVVAWLQLRDTAKWNRRNAAYTYFPSAHELGEVERGLEEAIRFFTRPQTEPLSELEAKALHGADLTWDEVQSLRDLTDLHGSDEELVSRFRNAGRHLKHYLSDLERYSLAINKRLVDRGIAEDLFRSQFLTHFSKAESHIRHAHLKADGAYCELEAVVNRWSQHRRVGRGAG